MIKIRLFRPARFIDRLYPSLVWRFKAKNKVYLTFDDGPHKNITPWLLDFAQKEGVKLNFFWLGKNVEQNMDLHERVEQSNHFIGNHGYEHLNNLKTTQELFVKNIKRSKKLTSKHFYRPPYGKIPSSYKRLLPKDLNIIMWSWLSYDWDPKVSDEKILKKLKHTIRGGHILVFHENDKTDGRIQYLLPEVIEIIREKGYTFGLISEEIK